MKEKEPRFVCFHCHFPEIRDWVLVEWVGPIDSNNPETTHFWIEKRKIYPNYQARNSALPEKNTQSSS